MRLFYDLRLGYLVEAPGQQTAASGYQGKAGDSEEIQIQFGRSSDPTGSNFLFDAPTWTAEQLPGGTVIKIGVKEEGDYSDGTLLASTSSFTWDATDEWYEGLLDLNTTEINTALQRGDADATDDVASLACGLEVTFQLSGSGPWRSSVLPVEYTIYHDLIYGDEDTPASAASPDEYLLKIGGIEWLPTVTSKIGGTAADLDGVATTTRPVNYVVAFYDTDGTPDIVRTYRLENDTAAENVPYVIHPDDHDASTNPKVWKLLEIGTAALTNPMTTAGDLIKGGSGGAPERLAIGTEDQFLRVSSGAPVWETVSFADTKPYPVSLVTQSSNWNVSSGDRGVLFAMDTSVSNVTATIDDDGTGSYAGNDYFFFVNTSSLNTATISPGASVNINGANSAITVAHNQTVRLWRNNTDDWYTF